MGNYTKSIFNTGNPDIGLGYNLLEWDNMSNIDESYVYRIAVR